MDAGRNGPRLAGSVPERGMAVEAVQRPVAHPSVHGLAVSIALGAARLPSPHTPILQLVPSDLQASSAKLTT